MAICVLRYEEIIEATRIHLNFIYMQTPSQRTSAEQGIERELAEYWTGWY